MSFAFVQITDHHLTPSEDIYLHGFSTRYAFRKVLAHIRENHGSQIDFVLSSGDLVDDAGERSYRAFMQMCNVHSESAPPGPLLLDQPGQPPLPFYVMPGNHDDRELFCRTLFPSAQPLRLVNCTFTHKGVQFIMLDWGPESKASAHPEMLGFLNDSLRTGLPAVLVMHHQLVPIGIPALDDYIADDLSHFWELLHGKPVLGILCGHVHASYEVPMHGIPVYGLRSTAPPYNSYYNTDDPGPWPRPHYRFIQVSETGLTTLVEEVDL